MKGNQKDKTVAAQMKKEYIHVKEVIEDSEV